MSENQQEMLSAEAARQFLGISRTTMHRLQGGAGFPGSKVGGQWRFRRADLETYLERAPQQATKPALPGLDDEIRWWKPDAALAAEAGPENFGAKIEVLADALLALAIKREASDIHIEPREDGALIRFRDDGVLEEIRTIPLALLAPLVAHFKKLCGLNASETRVPQRGRADWNERGDWVLQLATLPVGGNEALTLALLPRPTIPEMRLELNRIGLAKADLERVESWMGQPMGLILVVGPHGSGKNTTLTALMTQVTTPDRKVMAVEENLDVLVPGALQVATRASGLSAVTLLRAFFRHDPDVVVLGATNERAEFELLLGGAHEGRLVLAALAADSFSDAIRRIESLEVEPFLLSSALLGVVAQRLVRRVCPDCVSDDRPDAALVERARERAKSGGFEMPEKVSWKRGAGCSQCRGTGARGRLALYEVVCSSGEIANAITRRAPKSELETLARASGSMDLFAVGARAAVEGQISLSRLFIDLALPNGN